MKADHVYKHEFDAIFKELETVRNECIRLHPHLQDSHHVLQKERDALWTQWLSPAAKMDTLINGTCGSCKVGAQPNTVHDRNLQACSITPSTANHPAKKTPATAQ